MRCTHHLSLARGVSTLGVGCLGIPGLASMSRGQYWRLKAYAASGPKRCHEGILLLTHLATVSVFLMIRRRVGNMPTSDSICSRFITGQTNKLLPVGI